MSLDFNPIENVWKLLKMNLARKHFRTYKSLVSAIKKRMESLSKRSNNQSCTKYENRISDVISNKGDFVIYYQNMK